MSALSSAVITACAAAIVCAVLSNFVTEGSSRRLINLILGAFLVCSMIVPLKSALSQISLGLSAAEPAQTLTATADEALKKQVVSQTRKNLEAALTQFLLQNGFEINRGEIILAEAQENSIIISRISIYIDESLSESKGVISELVKDNFGIVPEITAE